LTTVQGVLTVAVSPVVMFVSWLLSPDWTSGDLFGLRAPFYKIWQIVANFIYFVYAILLVVIAVATMFNYRS